MTTTPVAVGAVVITAQQLRKKLDGGRDVVILEVRRDAADQDTQGRLPGAHPVALVTDLVGPPTATSGNLPLPTEGHIQTVIRRWGINSESIVVVYSQEHPALAARAWWTLRWAGVSDVRVLEGGVAEWVGAGGELTTEAPAPGSGNLVVTIGSLPTLDGEQAAALARTGVLLDARAPEAYIGESGGGHIPGAVSLPAGALIDDDGQLTGDDELRQRYESLGVSAPADGQVRVGAYCGGGTSATLTVLSLAKIGITAALYPGSFSAYSADATRPVASGNDRG